MHVMPWLTAIGVGIVVGIVIGYAAERVPVAPLLQSIVAALFAMVLGAVAATAIAFLRPPASGGGAIGMAIGVGDMLVLLGVGVFVAGLHILLGRVSGLMPALAHHRAITLGCFGGLCGTLGVAYTMVASMRSN
jgi:hypothetical protein